MQNSALIDTTIYVCGLHPYKCKLLLPDRRRFSYQHVADAMRKQKKTRLPYLDQGYFVTVWTESQCHVAIYKFLHPVGCSSVGSTVHGRLPNLMVNPSTMTRMTPSDLGLGQQYLYLDSGLNHGYVNPSRTQILTIKKVTETFEDERKSTLLSMMRTTFSSLFIDSWGQYNDGYCEFSGGGDILVCSAVTKAILCIYLPNRIKTATIELKYSHCDVDALELQLQANMALLGSKCVSEVISRDGSDVNQRTVYGIGFGVFHELVLLELKTDFLQGTQTYSRLFSSPPNPSYHLEIDTVISWVVGKLTDPNV
ncbi:hypothetical protein SPBRAN_1286 [uncultured Candidatus Thioglobus sp.]|nr:hypothetical protein SPBRAN_1286 [uncultured Candidatus Thioglobus sp.]